VELAMRIARLRIDVRVTALTMGPSQASHSLTAALALGADDAVHVCDEALHGSDALATSLVLSAALRKAGFDLVLCGAASSDSGMAVIPVMLAERLGVPAVCCADSVRADEDSIIGFCASGGADQDEGMVDEVACGLPALVSITDRGVRPRTPTFPSIAEARHKLVRKWTVAQLGIDPARVGLRGAGTHVRDVRTGRERGALVIDGSDPRAAASAMADFLAERHFV
jgi:electron transfer flavoprotein beta subunit